MSLPIPILFAARSLGHGGGERQLATTALNLDRQRFAPHVLSVEGGFWEAQLREAGIPLYRLPITSFVNSRAAIEAWRLRQWLRRNGIRLVLTFDFTMNVFVVPVARSVPGMVALSNQRCELSVILPRYQKITRWIHRGASGVLVNSPHLVDELFREWAIPASHIHVCPNGLDTTRFHATGRTRLPQLANARLVVGTASVLRPEKNIFLLIEAFAAVCHPNDHLVIVGSGPELDRLTALATQRGIARQCLFVPSTSDVAPWLRSMDVFVLASRSEGQSNALMEAMATGCCVVAADIGGNRGLITPGVNGLLFTNEDVRSLGDRLAEGMAEASTRERLALAASTVIARDYAWPVAVKRLESTLDRFLQSGNRLSGSNR